MKCAEFLTGVWSKCKVSRFLRGVLLADVTSLTSVLMAGAAVASPSTLSWPFSSIGLARDLVTRRWALSVGSYFLVNRFWRNQYLYFADVNYFSVLTYLTSTKIWKTDYRLH